MKKGLREALASKIKTMTREERDQLVKDGLAESIDRWMKAYVAFQHRKKLQREATRRFRQKEKKNVQKTTRRIR